MILLFYQRNENHDLSILILCRPMNLYTLVFSYDFWFGLVSSKILKTGNYNMGDD